jgi:hypothetical protein
LTNAATGEADFRNSKIGNLKSEIANPASGRASIRDHLMVHPAVAQASDKPKAPGTA